MNNFVDIEKHRYPVGSEVWHKKYRVCLVVAQNKNLRTLKVLKLGMKSLDFHYAEVSISELEKLMVLN